MEDDDPCELLRRTRKHAAQYGTRWAIYRTADGVLMGHSFMGNTPKGLRGPKTLGPAEGVGSVTQLSLTASPAGDPLADLRVLSLWRPWSAWVADHLKALETRTWSTKYRGLLGVHGTAAIDQNALHYYCDRNGIDAASVLDRSPVGIVAVAELYDVRVLVPADSEPALNPDREHECGLISPSMLHLLPELLEEERKNGTVRYAWCLRGVRKLAEPVVCGGRQRIWRASPEVVERVRAQLEVR